MQYRLITRIESITCGNIIQKSLFYFARRRKMSMYVVCLEYSSIWLNEVPVKCVVENSRATVRVDIPWCSIVTIEAFATELNSWFLRQFSDIMVPNLRFSCMICKSCSHLKIIVMFNTRCGGAGSRLSGRRLLTHDCSDDGDYSKALCIRVNSDLWSTRSLLAYFPSQLL